ncbi:MAG: amino acid adenylation domain-containing protein [Nitrospira sp.]|nr:amino acid adenylation domain-containing protein [Nitrospira sp.]
MATRVVAGAVLDRHLTYWTRQLAGDLPVIELPTDRPRGAVQTSSGSRYVFTLPQALAGGLRELSRRHNVTLFMTLLAVFQTWLMRYTGIDDVCVGTPIACRTKRETEDLIGFFANTLVLRTDLSQNPTFRQLLERVREVVLGGQEHQELPFEELVDALKPARALSHSPLFQVLFALQTTLAEAVRLPGLHVEITEVDAAAAKFDLSLDMAETEAGLEGAFEYNTDLFDAATVARMAGHFQTLLAGIVATPDCRLHELPLLSVEERQEALLVGPDDRVTDECFDFAAVFSAQVERSPGAVAVECRGATRTYAELNREADRIAGALTTSGIGPDKIVALLLDRGIGLLTAIVGVLKAGGTYLPLDPSHPPARWGELIHSSTASVVLASESYRARVGEASPRFASGDAILLALEDVVGRPDNAPPHPRTCSPDQLAYVIYTSGSTGIPKGAMVTQRGLMNHLWSKRDSLGLGPNDVVAQTASACFDISVWQHLAALICGGRTLIVPEDEARDPVQLLTCLERDAVTVAETVPALLKGMVDGPQAADVPLRSLRWLLPTGEALPPQLCREWLRRYPHVPLVNAYGPAECADDVATATIASPPAADEVSMPIGRPIQRMRLVVVDRWLAPVPVGVSGELCIGGVGVGRGYLQDPGRTAAAFVPDPFGTEPGARLYRTGDLVRRRTGWQPGISGPGGPSNQIARGADRTGRNRCAPSGAGGNSGRRHGGARRSAGPETLGGLCRDKRAGGAIGRDMARHTPVTVA